MGWAIARPEGPVGNAAVMAVEEEKEVDTVVPAYWEVRGTVAACCDRRPHPPPVRVTDGTAGGNPTGFAFFLAPDRRSVASFTPR
jgi:hypothetical protein